MHKPNKPSKPAFETRENYFSSVSFHIGHDRCQDGNQNQILRIVSSYILCIAQVNYIVLGGGWLVLNVDYSLTQEVIGEGFKSSDKLSLWVRWTGKVNHSYFCFKPWMLNVPLNNSVFTHLLSALHVCIYLKRTSDSCMFDNKLQKEWLVFFIIGDINCASILVFSLPWTQSAFLYRPFLMVQSY